MGKTINNSINAFSTRLAEHLREPLYRNGYALVFSSFSTSGLGMLFWMLAARSYSSDDVGLNTAMLSAMRLLATLAQLNLMNALNRFIPRAGRVTFRLIAYSYLITVTVALFASIAFILGIDIWSPSLNSLQSNPALALLFMAAVMTGVIFVIQDGILTGLRQAIWVPVENFFFAVIKIALLILFAILFPDYGILAAWVIATIITLLPINYLIFRRLIPQHIEATKHIATGIKPREIVGYSAGDYIGTSAWRATTSLIPLMIVEKVSASANAHYYLSWTIAYSIFLISRNMGMSFITEAATTPGKLGALSQKVLLQIARMVIPAVLVLVIAAPYILKVFGNDYSSGGTAVFRLLCLSAIPNLIVDLYLSIARVQKRMKKVVLVQIALSILTLSLAYVLLESEGITGIGIALLASQTIMAVVLWFTDMRTIWLYRLNIKSVLHVLAFPRSLWWNWKNRPHVRAAYALVPDAVATIPDLPDVPPPATWKPQSLLQTVNDVTVITLGAEKDSPAALLKVSHSAEGTASLQHQRMILDQLQTDPRLKQWNAFLPAILKSGSAGDYAYLVERNLPGIDARHLILDSETRKRILQVAATTIAEFHQSTAESTVVNDANLAEWVDKPLDAIRQVCSNRSNATRNITAIDQLATQLRDALNGRQLTVSWIHGDFVPGNILVSPDGAQVTGILDWDLAAANELPQLDLVQLLLATRMMVERRELGHIVCDLLNGAAWMPHERDMLHAIQYGLHDDPADRQTLILVCWLRHIAANLKKSNRSARHWVWVTWNIESVLRWQLDD